MVKYINCPTCNDNGKTSEVCRCGDVSESPVSAGYVPMDDLEVKAEVFRVIRANVEKPKSAIMNAIKLHLPKIKMERISKALRELSA